VKRSSTSSTLKKLWKDDNFRQMMSEARKGHNVSLKTRDKISKANKGKVRSEEMRKRSSENCGWRGKPAWNRKDHNYKPYFCECKSKIEVFEGG